MSAIGSFSSFKSRMKSAESLERDLMENSYFYFVKTLSILAESPAEQCVAMDCYNVAWELRDDGLSVDYLIRQNVIEFTDDQIQGMKELSLALHALDREALKSGSREEQLKAMSNPGWQPVRDIAKKLIVSLAPRTLENRKFLNLQ
jgi:hypothetical protein